MSAAINSFGFFFKKSESFHKGLHLLIDDKSRMKENFNVCQRKFQTSKYGCVSNWKNSVQALSNI